MRPIGNEPPRRPADLSRRPEPMARSPCRMRDGERAQVALRQKIQRMPGPSLAEHGLKQCEVALDRLCEREVPLRWDLELEGRDRGLVRADPEADLERGGEEANGLQREPHVVAV